jgi:hypothetical protein
MRAKLAHSFANQISPVVAAMSSRNRGPLTQPLAPALIAGCLRDRKWRRDSPVPSPRLKPTRGSAAGTKVRIAPPIGYDQAASRHRRTLPDQETQEESFSAALNRRRAISRLPVSFAFDITTDAARKMRSGRIKSLKLEAALRLARELKISPWYLPGEPEPPMRLTAGPPDERHRRQRVEKARSDRAQLETAEGALLLHDEVVELRSRIRRLEGAVEELQSLAKASSEP